jgi:hypothetical protein
MLIDETKTLNLIQTIKNKGDCGDILCDDCYLNKDKCLTTYISYNEILKECYEHLLKLKLALL